MFSCEICYIFKNTLFKGHLRNELLLNFKDTFYVKIKFLKELFYFLTDGLCFFYLILMTSLHIFSRVLLLYLLHLLPVERAAFYQQIGFKIFHYLVLVASDGDE